MTSRFLNGSRYGRVARSAAEFQDSGGRKPEVFIKVVFDGCEWKERERKPRTLSATVSEAFLTELLEVARPQGRACKRIRRKGRGCKERRKIARMEKQRSRVKLSPAAKEFAPARVDPPLPRAPEPGSVLYQAVAERVMAEIVTMPTREGERWSR